MGGGALPGSEAERSPDYVLIGHITEDLVGDAPGRLGGSVLYCAITALRLGRMVGVVTACAEDVQLPAELDEADLRYAGRDRTTTFSIESGGSTRALRLVRRAPDIAESLIPPKWLEAPIVHLAPVMQEVPPSLALHWRPGLGVATPQGWLRRSIPPWGEVIADLTALPQVCAGDFGALILSSDDLEGRDDLVEEMAQICPLVVLTRAEQGCTVYDGGKATHVRARPIDAVDSVGAGDVFATAFAVRLQETADPVASAHYANCAAGLSVLGVGFTGIPNHDEILAALS